MVGLNHEMGRELLWRGFPTDQRGTVFSVFWDRRGVGGDRQRRRCPIATCRRSTDGIGRPSSAPSSTPGSKSLVVLLLRGELLAALPASHDLHAARPMDARSTARRHRLRGRPRASARRSQLTSDAGLGGADTRFPHLQRRPPARTSASSASRSAEGPGPRASSAARPCPTRRTTKPAGMSFFRSSRPSRASARPVPSTADGSPTSSPRDLLRPRVPALRPRQRPGARLRSADADRRTARRCRRLRQGPRRARAGRAGADRGDARDRRATPRRSIAALSRGDDDAAKTADQQLRAAEARRDKAGGASRTERRLRSPPRGRMRSTRGAGFDLLSTRHPLLLLPVRLETRFAWVDATMKARSFTESRRRDARPARPDLSGRHPRRPARAGAHPEPSSWC